MPVYGVPVDFETASSLAKSNPYKFQDWAISLTDGLASNPQKSSDKGIDGFGVLAHKPNNMDRKAIVVQVTGASGAQLAKFERLQTTIRNTMENAMTDCSPCHHSPIRGQVNRCRKHYLIRNNGGNKIEYL